MAFAFGLGRDTQLNQFQRDATQFKLIDMSNNIQRFSSAPAPPPGQSQLTAVAYVDYTFHALNRIMQQDQENDNSTTFLLEYQALLRSRIQQMITELTAALTRDLDRAMITRRQVWQSRNSAQGFSTDVEDAGGARMAYNFFTGFSNNVSPSHNDIGGIAYVGIPTFDPSVNATRNKVSIDTSADAIFTADNPFTAAVESVGTLRALGTAVLQQSYPEDGLTEAVLDNLMITHKANGVLYQETGGGFISHKNSYKFTDIERAAGANVIDDITYSAQNLRFLNTSILDNAGGAQAGNLNDEGWDAAATGFAMFNRYDNVKNEFQRVLYDTIFEFDQRNLLRDIMRLSEKNGFLNDIQIATTSSINTGTQLQASIKLNFIPRTTDRIVSATPTSVTVNAGASIFAVGDIVYLTALGPPETTISRTITGIAGGVLTFGNVPDGAGGMVAQPNLPTLAGGSAVKTSREDLGGRVQIIVDRFAAFYHS
ncbi:MAG: hypothetical protein CVV27_07860 [Candidatus Melainabacteria bacterium HGW-Melainabacteria-1]|nr:MAG: hypothetical protein CVV27_07860 [Candidatus Melainabacteria bacterium HGW-Melainabacteria-1]